MHFIALSRISDPLALIEGADVLAAGTQEKIGMSRLITQPSSSSYAESLNIGVITSGIPSPTLGKNIAMGYIKHGSHKKGTEVSVVVRGQPRKGVVSPMPFVPTKYWRGIAPA